MSETERVPVSEKYTSNKSINPRHNTVTAGPTPSPPCEDCTEKNVSYQVTLVYKRFFLL